MIGRLTYTGLIGLVERVFVELGVCIKLMRSECTIDCRDVG